MVYQLDFTARNGDKVRDLSFTSDGSYAIYADRSNGFYWYDFSGDSETLITAASDARVSQMGPLDEYWISVDDTTLEIRDWDQANSSFSPVETIDDGLTVHAARWSSNGEYFAVADTERATLYSWDRTNESYTQEGQHDFGKDTHSIEFRPDDSQLAHDDTDNDLMHVHNVPSFTHQTDWGLGDAIGDKGHPAISFADVGGTEHMIYGDQSTDWFVREPNNSYTQINSGSLGGAVESCHYYDGQHVAMGCGASYTQILDAENGYAEDTQLSDPTNTVNAAVYTSDGSRLGVASADGTVYFYNTPFGSGSTDVSETASVTVNSSTTATDSVGASETPGVTGSGLTAIAGSATASEAPGLTASTSTTAASSATASEMLGLTASGILSTTESASVQEAGALTAVGSPALADSATASEAPGLTVTGSLSAIESTDAPTVSEAPGLTASASTTAASSATASEAPGLTASTSTTTSESAGVGEHPGVTAVGLPSTADTATVTDAIGVTAAGLPATTESITMPSADEQASITAAGLPAVTDSVGVEEGGGLTAAGSPAITAAAGVDEGGAITAAGSPAAIDIAGVQEAGAVLADGYPAVTTSVTVLERGSVTALASLSVTAVADAAEVVQRLDRALQVDIRRTSRPSFDVSRAVTAAVDLRWGRTIDFGVDSMTHEIDPIEEYRAGDSLIIEFEVADSDTNANQKDLSGADIDWELRRRDGTTELSSATDAEVSVSIVDAGAGRFDVEIDAGATETLTDTFVQWVRIVDAFGRQSSSAGRITISAGWP